MQRKLLKIFKGNVLLILLLFASLSGFAQQVTVRGIVRDSVGGLPGSSISVEGSKIGGVTDSDGRFMFQAPRSGTIVITTVGYIRQRIPLAGKTVEKGVIDLDVKLLPEASDLDEVTVTVAFGQQRKEAVVGSVTTIKPTDLKVPSSNLTTALAGRVAGMIAYQRSGEPGADNADFFIRGVTTFGYNVSPLILIDNVEVQTVELARMQVDDIASFSIMKDAAATALYGARGANGVILITTKQGSDQKTKMSLRLENSSTSAIQNVELADPITFMRLANEAVLTRDPLGITLYSDEKIDKTIANADPYLYPVNDWLNTLMKKSASTQRANLSLTGGGKAANYYVSGSLNKSNGMLNVPHENDFNNNINLKSYTLRSNVNINLTPTSQLMVRLSGLFDDYSGPIDGGTEVYNKIIRSNPVLFPAFYPKERYNGFSQHILFGNFNTGEYVNPYADMVRGYKEYTRSSIRAQLEFKQDLKSLLKGLSGRALFSTNRDSYYDLSRAYNPFYYSAVGYVPNSSNLNLNLLNEATATEYLDYVPGIKEVSANMYAEAALNFTRDFGKHTISSTLVGTLRNNVTGNGITLEASLPYRNLGLSGRLTYGYGDRYFTEVNFGYNASERFSEDYRWGFFPSIGAGWVISNEPFYKGSIEKYLSKLKLKASYGLVGNDNIGSGRFLYLSNVNMNDATRRGVFGKDGGYSRDGIFVNRYSNESITWETAKKFNAGIEATVMTDLQIQAEYFRENRTNILMDRASTPASLGLAAIPSANIGEASNKGFDMSMDYKHNFSNNWWLQGRVNYTYATSKYITYEQPLYDSTPWKNKVGYSLSQTWGYIGERLFIDDQDVKNSPKQNFGVYGAGDIKFRDMNDDGQITQLDQVPIGNPTSPEVVYGFGLSAGYKNWDLSCFFQGVGNTSFWINATTTAPFVNNNQLLKVYADSHWSEDNRDIYALWPRLSPTLNNNNAQTSTWFMRDGTFIRLKSLELGYSLPKKLAEKLHCQARVYLTGLNLLTFSKFKLWDPEMASNGLGYPIQRVYNIGVNISL